MSSIWVAAPAAEVFARTFDALEATAEDIDELASWLRDAQTLIQQPTGLIAAVAERLRSTEILGGDLGEELQSLLDALGAAQAGDRRDSGGKVLAVLITLDRILMAASRWSGAMLDPTDVGLAALRSEMAEHGCWSCRAAGGRLFPGRTRPLHDPAESLQDAVQTRRLNSEQAARLVLIPLGNDLNVGPSDPVEALALGMLAELEDVTMQVEQTTSERWVYRPTVHAAVGARVGSAAAALGMAAASADPPSIALLPELSCDDAVTEAWSQELRRRILAGEANPSWILIGSGPHSGLDDAHGASAGSRPITTAGDRLHPNRAVVLSSAGAVLAVADKLHGYSIPSTDHAAYGLKPPPAAGERTIAEGFAQGHRLVLLESRLGRLAVLICEDLDRLENLADLIVRAGVTHVLNPIFAKAVMDPQWTDNNARWFRSRRIVTLTVNGLARVTDAQIAATPPAAVLSVFDPDQKNERHAGTAVEPLDSPASRHQLAAVPYRYSLAAR